MSDSKTTMLIANAVCNTLAGFNILPGQAVNMALLSVVSVCVGQFGRHRNMIRIF